MKPYKIFLYSLSLVFLNACEPDIDEVNFNGGNANFSTTVAVGNSLVAGFQSNALSLRGQENSLPNIVAEQLKLVGGGEFTQPLLEGDAAIKGAGLDLFSNNLLLPELVLAPSQNCLGETSLAPQLGGDPYPATSFFSVDGEAPFNNVAVPGARVGNLAMVGYGSDQGNPYFARFASSPNETMLDAAMRFNPTFFILWIGNNDVLGYATSGGDEGGDAITPEATFRTAYQEALNRLVSGGAKGVIANIPDVTAIPFFTTIPIGTVITQEQADQLNSAYGAYNAGLDLATDNDFITEEEAAQRKINFQAGENPFVVMDPNLTDLTALDPRLTNMRQIRPGELLTLRTSGDSLRCGGWGTAKAIPGEFHISEKELDAIRNAINAYNQIIKTEAESRNLALVDANALLNQLATVGITESGIDFSSELVSGGAFSFDGVHPATRGYAILANEFIRAINRTYDANVPRVDITDFPAFEVQGL